MFVGSANDDEEAVSISTSTSAIAVRDITLVFLARSIY